MTGGTRALEVHKKCPVYDYSIAGMVLEPGDLFFSSRGLCLATCRCAYSFLREFEGWPRATVSCSSAVC